MQNAKGKIQKGVTPKQHQDNFAPLRLGGKITRKIA
jgi:hypothetical protein